MIEDLTTRTRVASVPRESIRCIRRLSVLVCIVVVSAIGSTGCAKMPADEVVAQARELAARRDAASLGEAILTLKPLIGRKQTPASVTNLYIALHVTAQREDEVLDLAEKHAQASPSDYMAFYLLGKIYAAHRRDEDALAAFKTARTLNADSLPVLLATAKYAGRENDPEAGEYFRQLEAYDASLVDRVQLYNEWGLWLAQQENGGLKAIQYFAKGWDVEKNMVLALNTAIVYERYYPKTARRWYLTYKQMLPADDYIDRHKMVQHKLRLLPE